MEMFGLQPCAKAGIENLWLTLPEVGIKSALNLEVIELQLDCGDGLREIAPDIAFAYVESGDTTAFGVCFHNHWGYLLFNFG